VVQPASSIRFLGHSTALVRLGGLRILTDPVLRNIGPLRRHGPPAHESAADVDVVLVSHAHHDHLDLPSLRRLHGEPLILVPAGLGRVVRGAGLRHVREVRAGDEIDLGDGVRVLAVPAKHDGFRPPIGPRAAALGYLAAGHNGPGIYFAGDTDLFPAMAELQGSVDVALLPVWGWGPYLGPGHLTPRRAAEAAALVGARLSVPIHWGGLFPRGLHRVWPHRLTAPPIDFARSVEETGVPTDVRIIRPGDEADVGA
jgi:L-ascorbate metabolism protein UlaG (beta-lactamase superfamily)